MYLANTSTEHQLESYDEYGVRNIEVHTEASLLLSIKMTLDVLSLPTCDSQRCEQCQVQGSWPVE
jgi:hypothetical protein